MYVNLCFKEMRSLFQTKAGGPSMCCERWSDEAATTHADMQSDQLHVPAFSLSCDKSITLLP